MFSRHLIRLAQSALLCLAVSATAFAQYGGGGGVPPAGSGPGGYTAPSSGYGAGKAIGIGVGVAAAVAGIALFVHHRHSTHRSVASVVGGPQSANAPMSMTKEKDSRMYSLRARGADLKTGERVELSGKKTRPEWGSRIFQEQELASVQSDRNMKALAPTK